MSGASTTTSGTGALRYDPDFLRTISAIPGGQSPQPPPKDVFDLRATTDFILSVGSSMAPVPSDIAETTLHFTAKDGTSLPLYRFTPPNATRGPAVLYIHGGGMVAGNVQVFKPGIFNYAAAAAVTVYAVGYRLAPEHPYPTPVEDVYSALEWLHAYASEEGIDKERIGLCGASAGGGLAAGAALMARDKGLSPALARLVLIYPMLDDRTTIKEDDPLAPFLTWTAKHNQLGWGAYLKGVEGDVSPYAAPARAKDLSGLPRTYVDVGSLDLFRDEDIDFAARLAKANVDVELHLYPGLPHGWEFVASQIPVSKRADQNRVAALSDF
ncbi:hypothetical protein OQA88_1287 [Cercophora sp. LCS_1]